ncbi:TAXI family TRAP transporter solute-binding subunit [Marinivivus vitaminiproducens]|uniref:TAXI family TRAP transporter solute-binding subunit n=1 Tax=Marinivivus vitaminiproducens TaxID=3035935 RepID=UPI0027AB7802|nr:TAXI family TRAP transporter solute-binding subunit [Geminicoccaceae bacterium SCSIO 64248]
MKKSLLALTLFACVGSSAGASAQQLRLMTGPQGGSWYPLGGAIQAMAQESLGVGVQVLPGGGIANVQGVETGAADLGFANSISVVDAIEGRPPFEAKAANVCNVATLYPQYFQMVVMESSGIESVEDFADRRLATQPVGNTAEEVIRAVLKTANLSYDDLSAVDYVSYSDGVSLMQDGNTDIFVLGTTVPASSIMDLANSSDIKLVPLTEDFITRMRELNPGYTGITIPANSYPSQDNDVRAIAYATQVIARCDLDAEVVHGILGQMWQNRADLSAVANAISKTTLEQMAQDVGVPLHEGARQFYQEQGAL